jgi:hypothetical protein
LFIVFLILHTSQAWGHEDHSTACRLALAEAPARCDGDWFEAWRRPLADLCAGHGARGLCCQPAIAE